MSTSAPTFVVRAFRLGWYRGALGRLTWTSAEIPGRRQPGPSLLSAPTRTVYANWRPTTTVSTTGWTPGVYLLRLDAADRQQSYVPLTVQAPSAVGRVVLVDAVTTWEAYNTWGCCDLYRGAHGSFATRSRAVSFDRPYANGDGAGELVDRELGVIAEAERLGLPLDYVTDADLEQPHLLDGARAVVLMGHDEYWSVPMRAALASARDAGTNLAVFGANSVFRRIRLSATGLGPRRLETDYKIAAEDPYARTDPALVTANWPVGPHAAPESALLGEQYGCFPGRELVPGVVVDPGSWVFAGSGVRRGTLLAGLVGPEVDSVQLGYPMPRPLDVLLHSPVSCPGGVPTHQDTTYYVAPSGAGVFDAGTIDWACDLVGCRAPAATQLVVRRVTANVLLAFAAGPAGLVHAARDDLRLLGIAMR